MNVSGSVADLYGTAHTGYSPGHRRRRPRLPRRVDGFGGTVTMKLQTTLTLGRALE